MTTSTWRSGRPGQQRSLMQAGAMTTGMTGTRVIKDWEGASDLESRHKRFADFRMKRNSSWAGPLAGRAGGSIEPLARGPRFEAIESGPETIAWHENKVTTLFKNMDLKGYGTVRRDQLQDSLAKVPLYMDEETFLRYAEVLLPVGADNITFEQFMQFHKVVWSNQPAHIRHRAAGLNQEAVSTTRDDDGKEAADQPTVKQRGRLPTSPNAGLSLHKSGSMPSIIGAKDIYKTEAEVRKAYAMHVDGPYGRLDHQELQALILDLGLDTSMINVVEASAKTDLLSKGRVEGFCPLTFQEFVDFQNRYIGCQESIRAAS